MAHCPFASFLISSCFKAQAAPASFAVVSADAPLVSAVEAAGGGVVTAGAEAAGGGAEDVALMLLGVSFLQPEMRKANAAAKTIDLGKIFIFLALLKVATVISKTFATRRIVPFSAGWRQPFIA